MIAYHKSKSIEKFLFISEQKNPTVITWTPSGTHTDSFFFFSRKENIKNVYFKFTLPAALLSDQSNSLRCR